MAYNMAWTPQQDVDQVNARNKAVDPVQYNQTLLNQLDTDNNFAASRSPQWSRYGALMGLKGAQMPQAPQLPLASRQANLQQFGNQSRADITHSMSSGGGQGNYNPMHAGMIQALKQSLLG